MRIGLDANVIISGIISPKGNAAKILDLWEQGEFDLVLSQPILDEIRRVLAYPRIKEKYNLPEQHISKFLELISNAIIELPLDELNVIEDDPSDNRYLECALASSASYIISGDAHLLQVGEYEGILIIPPTTYLTLLASKPSFQV